MALTIGQWTEKTVNGKYVAECVCSTDGNDTIDIFTNKTPKGLDSSKPWTLFVYIDEDYDASAAYIHVWGGWSDNFKLNAVSHAVANATDGARLVSGTTDIKGGGAFATRMIPANTGTVTEVSTHPGAIFNICPLPYYAFNIKGSNAIDDAVNVKFVIVQ